MPAPPAGPATFSELNLDFRVLSVVKQLGWSTPTPIQRSVVPLALSGRDVIAQARTGSGKTAAFALPILQALIQARSRPATPSSVRAIVVCPTRDLSAQTARTLHKFTSAIPSIPPAVDISAHRGASQATLLAAGCLVGTAAAVAKALVTAPAIVSDVQILVVDEADAVLASSGSDAAQLRRTLTADGRRPPQALVLSATLPADLSNIKRSLLLTAAEEVRLENEPTTVTESMIPVRTADRPLCAFALFQAGILSAPRPRKSSSSSKRRDADDASKPSRSDSSSGLRRCVLFVNDVASGFRLKLLLEMAKVPAGILHERLPANSRVAVVAQFNAGAFDVLVAVDPSPEDAGVKLAESNAYGAAPPAKRRRDLDVPDEDRPTGPDAAGAYGVYRGVDLVGVDVVVSVDPPHSVGSYVHRVGRTGRGTRHGISILLHDPDVPSERLLLRQIRDRQIASTGEPRPLEHERSEDGTVHAAMERVRYRIEDALRRLTKTTLRAAEIADLDAQIVNSEKLTTHFAANPNDLVELRKASASSKAKLGVVGHALAALTSQAPGTASEGAHRARMEKLFALAKQLEPPRLRGITEPIKAADPTLEKEVKEDNDDGKADDGERDDKSNSGSADGAAEDGKEGGDVAPKRRADRIADAVAGEKAARAVKRSRDEDLTGDAVVLAADGDIGAPLLKTDSKKKDDKRSKEKSAKASSTKQRSASAAPRRGAARLEAADAE